MGLNDEQLRTTMLYQKTLGGLIGDAIGTPTESKHYLEIEKE